MTVSTRPYAMEPKILTIPPDPRAMEIVRRRAPEGFQNSLIDREYALRSALGELVLQGLAPADWTSEERVLSLLEDKIAASTALTNPGRVRDAERILREGLAGSTGHYIGLRSWHALLNEHGVESEGYMPTQHRFGFGRAWEEDSGRLPKKPHYAREWLEATAESGKRWAAIVPCAWSMAEHILCGPPWIAELYRTGLGLWLWRSEPYAPQWALIVRPGEGLPWPLEEAAPPT